MPTVFVICKYCGHKDKTYVYSMEQEVPCEKCRDRKTIKKPIEEMDTNPFGYDKEK